MRTNRKILIFCYHKTIIISDLIKSDCLAAKDRLGNISRERIEHVNPEQALTLNDVGVLANGDTLTTYDTMVLHGEAIEDQLFADDIIDRLEKVNLKGKNSKITSICLIE